MPTDPNRPILRLPSGASRRRTAKGSGLKFPDRFSIGRQTQRLGPKLQRLRDALAAPPGGEAIRLRDDPTALAPESLIVFELKEPLVTFIEAIRAIPGLEFIGEGKDDEEFAAGDEAGSDDDGPGHYYAVFSNQAALNQMLSLWDRWVRGQSLPDQYKEWDRVFACLQDLRRWGARDRVSLTHAERLRELATAILDGATVHIEIELVFRRGDAADNARTAIRRQLAAIGAREITAARHDGFAYDALLVEVSKAAALEIAERADRGIAGLGEAYRVRPQSVGQGEPSNDSAASTLRDVSQPRSEGAIAAIFDALPVQNHPLLAGRLNVSDPDDLERLAVGPRLHGTCHGISGYSR